MSLLTTQSAYPTLPLNLIAVETKTQTYQEDDEDLPFDNSTVLGKVFNWAARLFLWFIYLTIVVIILAVTQWFLTAKSFWSWLMCVGGVFFYGMLLGRYWGYGTCLSIFAIVFTSLKIYLTSAHGRQKSKRYIELLSRWTPFQKDINRPK